MSQSNSSKPLIIIVLILMSFGLFLPGQAQVPEEIPQLSVERIDSKGADPNLTFAQPREVSLNVRPLAPGGVSDWEQPHYDAGNSNFNAKESFLSPPISQNIRASFLVGETANDVFLGNVIQSNNRLFLVATYKTDEIFSQNIPELRSYTELGIERWRYGPLMYGSDPSVQGDTVLVVNFDWDNTTIPPVLVALDSASGNVRWSQDTGESSQFVAKDNVVYYFEANPNHDAIVVARDVLAGTERWRTTLDGDFSYLNGPIISGGYLILHEASGLIALSLNDGTEAWRVEKNDVISLIANGQYVYVSSGYSFGDRFVTAYASDSGAKVWEFDRSAPECNNYYPALGVDDKRLLYFEVCEEFNTGGSHGIYALNPITGEQLWQTTSESPLYAGPNTFAIANDVLYTRDINRDALLMFDLNDGSLIQKISASVEGALVDNITVSNGQVFGSGIGVIYVFDRSPNVASVGYLQRYDEDAYPYTNPLANTEVPLIDREGDYGARITVGARVVTDTATIINSRQFTTTFRIYDSDGNVYKSAIDYPDEHGNAYWFSPLEYTPNGYEYDVELLNGTFLPRRKIKLPTNPDDNIAAIQDLDGLSWINPPNNIGSLPTTLRLALPGAFPDGTTRATLHLRSNVQGGKFIQGQRVGDMVEFELTSKNVVQGNFIANAVAESGHYTAFSPDHALNIDASARKYLPGMIVAGRRNADGSMETVVYKFESDGLSSGGDRTGEIIGIVPGPNGYQITGSFKTPEIDLDDPRTKSPTSFRIRARDSDGGEIGRTIVLVPPGADGVITSGFVPTNGQIPESIEIEAPVIPPPNPDMPLPPPPEPPPACNPPPPSPPDDPGGPDKPELEWSLRDSIHIVLEGGIAAEGVYGVGIGGAAYEQIDLAQGTHQECVEFGVRGGKGVALGPAVEAGFAFDLPGPGHEAPAQSGTKIDLGGALGKGVKVAFTIPDNWERGSSIGSLSIGLTEAPKAGVTAGVSRIYCQNLMEQLYPASKETECCAGGNCPPLPGERHPDDTLSVVSQNESPASRNARAHWQSLARYANAAGFAELERYANYQVQVLNYLAEIESSIPASGSLTPEQDDLLNEYHAYRRLKAVELGPEYATALSQLRLLEGGDVYVLVNGYYAEMVRMLDKFAIASVQVGTNFSPADLGQGLLIIPTGGLYGLGDVQSFRDRLKTFVEDGGTLLVMSQPYDHSLDALPGMGLSQVGYINDLSCFQDAMTLETYHPMLASISEPTISSNVDGYLTTFPANTTRLLKRTKNGQGAFALYEYGQGQVIVTNMYDDWGPTVGQTTVAVRNLFRDVVRWASDPGELVEFHAGETKTLGLPVKNQSDSVAVAVRYIVRNPLGEVVEIDPSETEMVLQPGQSTTLDVEFTLDSGIYGIWQFNYDLVDLNNTVIQSETAGEFFTFSNPPALNLNLDESQLAGPQPRPVTTAPVSAQVTANLDDVSYAQGDPVELSLGIVLSDPASTPEIQVVVTHGGDTQEQIVTAAASQTLTFNFTADFDTNNGLIFYGVYDNATGQGLTLNTRWLPPQGDVLTVTLNQPLYAPGDTVTMTLNSIISDTIFFDGPGLTTALTITKGISQHAFILPNPLSSGPYLIRYLDGNTHRDVRFDVKGPMMVIDELQTDTPQSTANAPLDITATIKTDVEMEVYLLGTIIKPEANFRVLEQRQTLSVGTQTLTFSVPFSVTTSGMARFELSVVDANDPNVTYVSGLRYLNTTAPELLALRPDQIQIESGTMATINLDWYSPSAQDIEVTVQIDDTHITTQEIALTQGYQTASLMIPVQGSKGDHTLTAYAFVDGLTTQAQALIAISEASDSEEIHLYLPMVVK